MSDVPKRGQEGIVIEMLQKISEPPRAWTKDADTILAEGRRLRRRRRMWHAGGVGAAATCAAIIVAATPLDRPNTARPDVVLSQPSDDASSTTNACPEFDRRALRASPGLDRAVNEILTRYEMNDPHGPFTSVRVCIPLHSIEVYRVPGNATFDVEVAKIAAANDVGLRLLDTGMSLEELNAFGKEVFGYQEELKRKGANILLVNGQEENGGYVEVSVSGNIEAAREIYSKYGSKVRVVEVTGSTDGFEGG